MSIELFLRRFPSNATRVITFQRQSLRDLLKENERDDANDKEEEMGARHVEDFEDSCSFDDHGDACPFDGHGDACPFDGHGDACSFGGGNGNSCHHEDQILRHASPSPSHSPSRQEIGRDSGNSSTRTAALSPSFSIMTYEDFEAVSIVMVLPYSQLEHDGLHEELRERILLSISNILKNLCHQRFDKFRVISLTLLLMWIKRTRRSDSWKAVAEVLQVFLFQNEVFGIEGEGENHGGGSQLESLEQHMDLRKFTVRLICRIFFAKEDTEEEDEDMRNEYARDLYASAATTHQKLTAFMYIRNHSYIMKHVFRESDEEFLTFLKELADRYPSFQGLDIYRRFIDTIVIGKMIQQPLKLSVITRLEEEKI